MKIFFWETCNGDEFKINRKNQAQADFQTVLMKYITHSSEIRGLCLMK